MNFEDLISRGRIILRTKIDGDLEGFDDEKVFPLINGQYLIQTRYKYWYHYKYMADVTIFEYQNGYFLSVDGQNQFVEVEVLDDVIKATIISDFRGWSGNTVFELDNGQIWKQSEYDYDYNYSYRPEALIYSNGYGHKISVEGKCVAVKRIK